MDDLDTSYEVSRDPDREAELHSKAWEGLRSANLTPLAELLRSEFEIETTLRATIADAIEGESKVCQIAAKYTRRGKPAKDEGASNWRDLQIEFYVRQRSRSRGQTESAHLFAMDHFGIAMSSIAEAVRRARLLREAMPKDVSATLDRAFEEFGQD